MPIDTERDCGELRIQHRGPMQPMQAGLVLNCRNPSYDNMMTLIASAVEAGIEMAPRMPLLRMRDGAAA
jgi:hypothetical protein